MVYSTIVMVWYVFRSSRETSVGKQMKLTQLCYLDNPREWVGHQKAYSPTCNRVLATPVLLYVDVSPMQVMAKINSTTASCWISTFSTAAFKIKLK